MRYYLFIVLLLLSSRTISQTAHWAHSIASEGYDEGLDLTTDHNGNVYVTGQIEFLIKEPRFNRISQLTLNYEDKSRQNVNCDCWVIRRESVC